MFRCAVIVAAKGGMLADITVGDVLEILDTEYAVRGRAESASATIRMLREAGVLDADTPTLAQIRSLGQRSVAQLVDRYPIACRPIRDLLVAYLSERRPAIDYTTLVDLAYHLVRCFWLTLSSIIAASTRCGCHARSPARGNAGCAPKPPPSPATTNASRSNPNASATSTRWPRCGRSTSTWPNGGSTTRSGGVCGWHRARSASRTWSAASSFAAARPAWTAAPANGCPCYPCWPKPPTGGVASPSSCCKPGNRPGPARSSPLPERP